MNQQKSRRVSALRRWHRRAGILACAGIFIWALSGSLHPLLTRYQPQAATTQPPPLPAHAMTNVTPLRAVARRHGITHVQRVRLVSWTDRVYFQLITSAGARRYIDTQSGAESERGDQDYASALARHYLGDERSEIASITQITAFDAEYTRVNRLLPVVRVAFAREDGMRVYVDTATSALATQIDDRKALYTSAFTLLHNWHFAGSGDFPRVPLAALFVAAALASTVLGAVLWLHTRGTPQRSRLRRGHRAAGALVGVMIAASASSGGWHLIKGALDRTGDTAMPDLSWTVFRAASIAAPWPEAEAVLVAVGGVPCYRIAAALAPAPAAGHHADAEHTPAPTAAEETTHETRYIAAAERACAIDDRMYTRLLAQAFTGLPHSELTAGPTLTRFEGEYGFINKLLPVTRVDLARGERLYIHLERAALAARIDAGDYAEGWTFAHLHKWQWLEFIGRWPRDLVMIAFALTAAGVAVAGLLLFAGARR